MKRKKLKLWRNSFEVYLTKVLGPRRLNAGEEEERDLKSGSWGGIWDGGWWMIIRHLAYALPCLFFSDVMTLHWWIWGCTRLVHEV